MCGILRLERRDRLAWPPVPGRGARASEERGFEGRAVRGQHDLRMDRPAVKAARDDRRPGVEIDVAA